MINAQVAALRLQADDGVRLFAVSVVNDALEFAATQVAIAIPHEPPEVQAAVAHFIRDLKR